MGLLKTMGIASGIAAIFLSANIAFAEDDKRAINTTAIDNVKVETDAKRSQAIREEAKKQIENIREEAKTRVETEREKAKQKIETAREEVKARVEAVREKAKVRVETQREKAKERLSDIRDKAKQQMAEKLAEQFENLNKKWTDHFIQQLDKLNSVLIKIQDRTDVATTNGKDTTATNTAIQSAIVTIETAQTAVTAQAAKTYVLDPSVIPTTATTTQSGQEKIIKNLRTAFQTLHSTLFKDLFALRDGLMMDARRAVQNAVQTLGKIPKVDDDNATSTESSNE